MVPSNERHNSRIVLREDSMKMVNVEIVECRESISLETLADNFIMVCSLRSLG